MKKTTTTIIAIFICATVFAQKDTVYGYVRDQFDTVKVDAIMYKGENNVVKYTSPGYYIVRQQMSTTDGKNFKPFGQPIIVAGLDDKKKQIKIFKQ